MWMAPSDQRMAQRTRKKAPTIAVTAALRVLSFIRPLRASSVERDRPTHLEDTLRRPQQPAYGLSNR